MMLALLCFLCLLILKAVFLNSESVQFNMTRTKREKEMLSYINDTVNPCDDFYEFACGNWEKMNPIPEDNVENSEFVKLNRILLHQVRELLEKPIQASDWEVEKKAKEFYASCINVDILKKRGLGPLFQFIKSVGGWPLLDDTWSGADFDWLDVITKFKSEYGISILLSTTVYDNVRDVSQNQVYISETQTSLPNKDYYYDSSKRYQLNAYKEYMLDIFQLFGVEVEKAQKVSEEILKFETDIAMGTFDSNVRPDFQALFVPMTVGDLQNKYPSIDWLKLIEKSLGITVNASYTITVVGDDYIPNLVQIISTANQKVIANYIMWMAAKSFFRYTDERFDLAEQKYIEAVVGNHKRPERWNYCISSTKNAFGFVIGAMYIRKHFSPEIKSDVQELAQSIQETFKNRLDDISWIDARTIEKLHEKIDKMQLVVGYPEYIMSEENLKKEYGEVEVDPKKYFENILNVLKAQQKEEREKLNNEVDRTARFYPVIANAFYEAVRNRIIIPAGILQYPIYNRHFPKASNFGQIGAILGHELTHGFDDGGQNFDPNGNMAVWWTESSKENFKRKTSCFVSHFNNYTYNGYKLRGEASVGENVAELGGLRQAYYAYKKWLKEQDSDIIELETLPKLDLTPTQLFFLSYAQVWCGAHTPEALRHKINIDSHMPSKYRVIGSLSNLEEFAEEFQCPLDSNMNPRNKCKLW